MIFTAPLGLLALLAVPAIVAIHLFRRRFPVRRVAGLFLWQSLQPTPEAGGRITRLPITASLILESLAAIALALIISGARLSPSGTIDHLVVLLDDSASMNARNQNGESARDRAAARVAREIETLGASARITLVQSGERPAVLAGPATFAIEARRALELWRPEAPHHSLALGLRLARELAGESGRLLVITDTVVKDPASGALWVSVGEPLENVGITAAHRTLSPEQDRGAVSLTLLNSSDGATRRRLTVATKDTDVLARELDVPPGMSSLTLPLPPGLPPVRVALSHDALLRDNEVVLAEPRPRVVGVDNRLKEGRGRDALAKALDAVAGVTRAESPHLLFTDATADATPGSPAAWRVTFGRAPAAGTQSTPEDFAGPFVLEKRHPLLQGVTLGGVVWTGAAPVPAGSARPLVSAGDRPLIGMSDDASGPVVQFNLDLDRTNLIRAPDWPILISNLVELRRRALPGPERWNYRVGEWVRIVLGRVPGGQLRYRIGRTERELPQAAHLELLAPAPGGLLEILEGESVLFELGVNFLDEREVELRDKASGEAGALVAGAGLRAETGPADDPLFWGLLAIAAAAMVANWALLAPRTARV